MYSRFRSFVLIAVLTALLLFVGNLIGGYSGLIIAGVFAVALNFGSWYFSDKIVLKMYRAKEAPQTHRLVKHVRHVASLANLPMPKVYIIPSASPNAFATGRNPTHAAVAATEGLLNLLSDKEVEGVIAHELAHVKNRDTLIQTIASTIAGVIGFVASMAQWAAIFGGFGGRDDDGGGSLIQLLVLAIVTPIAATLLQLAISRNREYLADETGASFTKNPHALASALEKLHTGIRHTPLDFGSKETSSMFIANPFRMQGLLHMLSTHPPMEKRIAKLRAMTV